VLQDLFEAPEVKVKPAVVQNRFYEDTLFDTELRIFCREHHIIYQSFWTLTANPDLVRSDAVQQLARQAQISPVAALYTLVMGLGDIAVLNGTTNEARMKEDLAAPLAVEEFIKTHPDQWQQVLAEFREMVGDPN
jgi:diketogulonate reductase-like aldo/keto reductase